MPRRTRSASSRDRPGEAGTAAVEFALVLPLLLVIALALVQVGLVIRDRLLVEEAARAGARAAAVEDDPDAIAGAARSAAPDLDASVLTVGVVRQGTRGAPVTVTVGYTSAIKVPLVSWLFGASVSMHSTTTDRQEFG
jgi:Flp pilus assembly protein TadG